MKYTRVKAVTCALTASVILFGSAAQTNASSVSYDLPAAGVGLVLEESSSLSNVQEEAEQSERAAEAVAEVQASSEVTHEDIESGVTGVGESAIDTRVMDHVQEQQVSAAIDNGVGVATVLAVSAAQDTPAAPVQSETAAEAVVSGSVGEVAVASVTDENGMQIPETVSGQTRPIVAPVDLKETQTAKEENTENTKQAEDAASKDTEQNKEFPSAEVPSPEGNSTESSSEDTSEEESEAADESVAEDAGADENTASDTEETPESSSEAADDTAETDSTSAADSSEEETAGSESDSQTETGSENTESAADAGQATESESGQPESTQPGETQTESTPAEGTQPSEPAETQAPASTEAQPADQAGAQTDVSAQTQSSEAVQETTAQTASEPAAAAAAASDTVTGSDVVDFAVQFVGNPYRYGGTSLTDGADCSGFVMSVYENFGVDLPHSSSADRNVGVDVGGLENAQPGDLICYSGHVAIYIGDNQIVHASTEKTGIKISDADYRNPVAVRRVLQ